MHQTPAGGTLTLEIYEAIGTGNADLGFGRELHKIPYNFNAIVSTSDFEGNALPPNTYFKMILETPPTA